MILNKDKELEYTIRTFFLLLLFCLSFQSISQEFRLKIIQVDTTPMPSGITVDSVATDTVQLIRTLNAIITSLQNDKYLSSGIDYIIKDDSNYLVGLYVGTRYSLLTIDIPGTLKDQLVRSAVISRYEEFTGVNADQFLGLRNRILSYTERNGYPLAKVGLSKIEIVDSLVSGELEVDLGPYVLLDSIHIDGNAKISPSFLFRQLELSRGTPYNYEMIAGVRQKLRSLSFVKVKDDPYVTIDGNYKATLHLPLEQKNASRFDFLIGMIPDPNKSGSNRFIFSGEILADLTNQLGYGERIKLGFQRLKPATQEIELASEIPYLLNTPFGVEADFGLLKQDSSYVNVKYDLGLRYQRGARMRITTYYDYAATILQDIDTAFVISNKRLPSVLDKKAFGMGIKMRWNTLDYIFNPLKGWDMEVDVLGGLRQIKRNQSILEISDEDFDYNSLYDDLAGKKPHAKIGGTISRFFRTGKTSTLLLKMSGAWIWNDQQVFKNELYRIGGTYQLRGFEEKSIYASLYGLFTGEFRILTGENSNIFTFFDLAAYENRSGIEIVTDRPFSFGAGISLDTKVGVFGVSYAIGKQFDNPISLSTGKVHFGFNSFF
jgi:outer membrane protein assembly factor BamA